MLIEPRHQSLCNDLFVLLLNICYFIVICFVTSFYIKLYKKNIIYILHMDGYTFVKILYGLKLK